METEKKKIPKRKQPKPHPIDIHVGRRIKYFRLLRGMSQTDIAKQIGVRFQQVQKYESASNRISSSRLYLIAEVLGVGIEDFFEDD